MKANGTGVTSGWESGGPKSTKAGECKVEGFRCHVGTDGSLRSTAGKCGACGWSVVQLDYDEELGLLHGMCGSMEAELQVQRTIKRAELTASFAFVKKSDWPQKGACGQQRQR